MAEPSERHDRDAAALDDSALSHLVGYAVVQANLTLLKVFRQAIGQPMNLRPVEFTLLTLLANNSGVTQKALGAKLQVQAPNLTVILNRLNERGLLTTQRNANDGRSVLIGLSAAGKTLQARAVQASRTMESQALSGLSQNERATLLRLLRRFSVGTA